MAIDASAPVAGMNQASDRQSRDQFR